MAPHEAMAQLCVWKTKLKQNWKGPEFLMQSLEYRTEEAYTEVTLEEVLSRTSQPVTV